MLSHRGKERQEIHAKKKRIPWQKALLVGAMEPNKWLGK